MNPPRSIARFVALGLCLTLASCSEADLIRQYTVAKPTPPAADPDSSSNERAGVGWFFKLTGPDKTVAGLAEPFAKLVGSVRFNADGQPEWKLPDGWTERREQGIRFATLTIPGDQPVEATVIPLPTEDPTSPAYLKDNYNRWRGQLALPPRDEADWQHTAEAAGELSQIESGGRTITIVNLTGKTEKEGEARMLAALVPSSAPPRSAAPRPPAIGATADSLPFTFALPEGWRQQPAGQFQIAKFVAGDEKQPLTVSVSSAGGDLAANVNRWRGQVQLAPIEPAEIEAAAKLITVAGSEGKLFTIDGATDSILGVILPRGGTSWFFKALGPTSVAQEERERFEAFVKSIQFRE